MEGIHLMLLLLGAAIGVSVVIYFLTRRVIVPSNYVHIVQRTKKTVSYGSKLPAGNTYYNMPKWLPIWGVDVRILPVSNFDIFLDDYAAYDVDRLPFKVDVKAFFRIADTNVAAQRVENQTALEAQLGAIVEDAVRSILAKSELEKIMQERNRYALEFTKNVEDAAKEWGCEVVKTIALMDIRDAKESNVIANIMAKKKSAIDMESRLEVANNQKIAEEAEILAKKEVEVKRANAEREKGEAKAEAEKKIGIANAEAERGIGIANAEAEKGIGLADQTAAQEIQTQAKITEEKKMEVLSVNKVRQAEIEKEALIVGTNAQKEALIIKNEAQKKEVELKAEAAKYQMEQAAAADKYRVEQQAIAKLAEQEKAAKGIEAVGKAEAVKIKEIGASTASAEKELQLARVTAEVTLAEKIGSNEGYQKYLVEIETIKVSGDVNKAVGIAQAEAMKEGLVKADVKIISNAGNAQEGIKSLGEVFTTSGGQKLGSMVEGLRQIPSVKKIIDNFAGVTTED